MGKKPISKKQIKTINLNFPENLDNYAVVDASIFDVYTGAIKKETAVLIEGKKISTVCSQVNLPQNVKKISCPGCTILPGLIDVHVHTEDWHGPLFLAMGVTTVRDVGCELEAVLSRRTWWNSEGTLAPHLLCTGPVLDCPGNTWPATTQIVKSPEDARAQVNYLVQRGVDQIKTYAFLDRPCFEAILSQAQIHGKFVLSHLGKNVDARQAIEAGVNEIEHLSGVSEAMWWEQNQSSQTWDWIKLWAYIDKERMNRLIDLILEKDIWMAVTRIVWLRLASTWDTSLINHPQMKYITGALLEYWEKRFPRSIEKTKVPDKMPAPNRIDRSQQVAGMSIFTSELIRNGAKILVGSDTPFPYLMPGFSFHDEIKALLDCGMSESEVIKAATLYAAEALEIDHVTGSIVEGKRADFIIVDGNPIDDIQALQKIKMVVKEGYGYKPESLLENAIGVTQRVEQKRKKRFDSIY